MDGDTGDRQERIWSGVAEIQSRLSASLAADGSLAAIGKQPAALAREREARRAPVEKLRDGAACRLPDKETDVVGYVFAVNGKLNSADLYPSNALFRKMWAKLLRASATEAIADADATALGRSPADRRRRDGISRDIGDRRGQQDRHQRRDRPRNPRQRRGGVLRDERILSCAERLGSSQLPREVNLVDA